mmetsp:Transcript_49670/g.98874  ORF Transcript_49670/g.98874 Transcript_49670/m.98874 type:complete len:257 (-) Transcript_49670:302-1072(-)
MRMCCALQWSLLQPWHGRLWVVTCMRMPGSRLHGDEHGCALITYIVNAHCSVDIGSGVGKAVVAVAMVTRARAIGLEIVAERAKRAAEALAEAESRGVRMPRPSHQNVNRNPHPHPYHPHPHPERCQLLEAHETARIDLRHGDALQPGTLPASTTFAYLSNLCFSMDLNLAIVQVLRTLPRLRCIGSLRELPTAEQPLPTAYGGVPSDDKPTRPAELVHVAGRCKLQLSRTLRVPMSWDDQTRLYIYCKQCDEQMR